MEVDKQKRKSLARQGTSTEAQFLRTIGGTHTPSEVKASEGMRYIITKDFDIRHEVVRVWWRNRNKPRVIQCGAVSKILSVEFSLIETEKTAGVPPG